MNVFFQLKTQTIGRCSVAVALVLLGLSIETEAQSGRRAARSSSPLTTPAAPDTTKAPTPDSTKQLGVDALPSKVRILVARQPTSKHLHTEDVIAASFVKRLNQYANLECSSIGDIKEGQAIARAKAETDAFVALLKFDIDSYQNGTIILNSQDLQVEYVMFAPRNGKKQTKGKVYFQGVGGGRMRKSDWPNGTPIKITPEAAGIEAAESLYSWIALTAASTPNPH